VLAAEEGRSDGPAQLPPEEHGTHGPVPSAELALLLTTRCNLSCEYCYLDRGRDDGAMRWLTVAASLGLLLDARPARLAIEFTGGEPLLAPDLLVRAVEFVERRRHPATALKLTLTTNGTLLTPARLSFLFAHGFAIRLSWDGVAPAQDLRGRGTFAALDRLLDRLRREFPEELAERVTVGMTLAAAAIPRLAASVRYFLDHNVGAISIGPRLTHDPDWKASSRGELEAQVEEIVALSVAHWRRTGAVPVSFLARPPLRDREAPAGDFLCGAPSATSFCVGPDGRVFACPLFEPSLVTLPPLARAAARALALGAIDDPRLARRLAGLPRRASGSRIFTAKSAKRSSYGACAECRFVADCHVCPASICHIPGNRDPDLVPDFTCAFNQVTLAARERFDNLTAGATTEAWYGEVEAALGKLEAALSAARPAGTRRRLLRHKAHAVSFTE
jgi:sulfatase maturation enzyme AslB (radical SAM superfamily)